MGYRNFVELPVQIAERFTTTISPRAVWRTLLDTFAIFYRLRVARFYGPQLAPASGQSGVPPDLRFLVTGRPRSLAAGALAGSGPTDRPLRILAYNWRDLAHPRAGGAEVYLQSVAREWVRCGHEVTIFCAAVDDRPARELADGVEIIRRGGRLGVYREARRYWRARGRRPVRPRSRLREHEAVPLSSLCAGTCRSWPSSTRSQGRSGGTRLPGRSPFLAVTCWSRPGCGHTGMYRSSRCPSQAASRWRNMACDGSRSCRKDGCRHDGTARSPEGACPDRCLHRTAERQQAP